MAGKRIMSALISLALLFPLASCAAAGDKGELEPGADEERVFLVENTEKVYPFGGTAQVKGIARIDATLLLLCEKGEETLLGLSQYTLNPNGGAVLSPAEEISIAPLPFEGSAVFYGITSDADGYFYLLAGRGAENAPSSLVIQRYDASGAYVDDMPIPDWDQPAVAAFSVGKRREIVLAMEGVLCVYQWQGGLIRRTEEENLMVLSACLCEQGVVVSAYDKKEARAPYLLLAGEGGEFIELPLSDQDPGKDPEYTSRRKSGSAAPCQGLTGEYLINQGDCICRIDFDNDRLEKLIEWNPTEEYSRAQLGPSCRLGEESFACLLDGELLIAWTERVERTGSDTVRVAALDYTTDKVMTRMVKHVQNSAACTYEVTNFAWDDRDRLKVELAAGAFDLVLFTSDLSTDSSAFENLYPYIDADEDLSRDAFLPHLLESMEVRGQLHQMLNCVMVDTYVTSKDYVSDPRGLTLVDCERIVAERDELDAVFLTLHDPEENSNRLLGLVVSAAVASFIDRETAACSFDSETFRDWLLWLRQARNNPRDDAPQPYLLRNWSICYAGQFQDMKQYIGGEPVLVGFPNSGDGLHTYALSNNYDHSLCMAIPANSQNKEGAWAFIKTMLSRSMQIWAASASYPMPVGSQSGIPVIYEVAKELSGAVQEEDRERFFTLLENTKYTQTGRDDELVYLIMSECRAYLNGDKTLEETIKVIQSRAGVYVSEQYG